jgi:hypothetical protein
LIPATTAFADDWDVEATGTETIAGIYGHGFNGEDTTPPVLAGTVQGDSDFAYTDTTTGDPSGSFSGIESISNAGGGAINTEVYVAGDVTGDGGPAVGSVFDTYSFADGDFVNIYSDVDGTVTDTLQTPIGDIALPVVFDATDGAVADAGGVLVGDGGFMEPVGSQTVNSITGAPPLNVAPQGTQDFDFYDSTHNLVGTVATDDTTTADIAGTYTEAVLVTSDNGLTNVGVVPGDVPAVGSLFNTINLFGLENVYSDLVETNGANVISDTLETVAGNVTIPMTFDAAQVESISDSQIVLPDGFTFTPTDDLNYTGINGLPPLDVAVQGGQDFSYTDGATSGSFTADVTNSLDALGDSTETILVTSPGGTDLPAGSEFEIVTIGDTGLESLYSDIASASGQDVISETLETPLGDVTLPPSFDAAAGLATDAFNIIAGV